MPAPDALPRGESHANNNANKLKNEYLRSYVKDKDGSPKKHKKDRAKKSAEEELRQKQRDSQQTEGQEGSPKGQGLEGGASFYEKRKADTEKVLKEVASGKQLTEKELKNHVRKTAVADSYKLQKSHTSAEQRMEQLMAEHAPPKVTKPVSQRTWFTSVIGLAVVANAVQLGVEVDYPHHKDIFAVLEHVFTAIFTVEMLLKLAEMHIKYFKDPWNLIDFVLVWLSIVDCWILSLLLPILIGDGSGSGDGPDLRIFSMLRILRILRLLRAVRLFKVFHELWKIVKGILDSLKAVGWAALLLIFLLYICGVFCCVMVGKNTEAGYLTFENPLEAVDELGRDFDVYQYFGTVPRSMYTLFETCIEPLNIRPVIERQPWMAAFFFAFIFISTFGVLNVIIGVIVEHTMSVSDENKNTELVKAFQRKMDQLELVRDSCFVDSDDDGNVSIEEIEKAFEDQLVLDTLEEVEMPLGLQPEEFFDLLDSNGNGQVTHSEMLMQLTRATVHTEHQQLLDLKIGLHSTQRQIHHMRAEFIGCLDELKSQVKYGFCQMLPSDKMRSWPTQHCAPLMEGSSQVEEHVVKDLMDLDDQRRLAAEDMAPKNKFAEEMARPSSASKRPSSASKLDSIQKRPSSASMIKNQPKKKESLSSQPELPGQLRSPERSPQKGNGEEIEEVQEIEEVPQRPSSRGSQRASTRGSRTGCGFPSQRNTGSLSGAGSLMKYADPTPPPDQVSAPAPEGAPPGLPSAGPDSPPLPPDTDDPGPLQKSRGSVSRGSLGASRKSMSRKASIRLITPNGPDGPKARALAELLSDIWLWRGKKQKEEEVAEKKTKALAIVASGVKPCMGSLFYYSCDDDKNRTLDRTELQEALTRIPSFSGTFCAMFEFKISELFSEGDGTIDVDEWLDLCEEIPDLKKAIEDDEVCKAWRDWLEP